MSGWRAQFEASRAVCWLGLQTIEEDLDRAGALADGAADLWERGAREADRELHQVGADAFPFAGCFHESARVKAMVRALHRDVEELRRERSRHAAQRCARLN